MISILFIQNCFWVNLENDSKIIEKKVFGALFPFLLILIIRMTKQLT
ncbi:hypothetical protein LEP1GSC100_0472 [Leptospira interrogans serovar Bataviae str. UI 08561]|nr:hypothetical protein LEP1GSC100_0472 [Leptospira interrogans serovar Bataviae str. UI 08561]